MPAFKYPDFVEGRVVDLGPGPIVTFPMKKNRREEETEESDEEDNRKNLS